MKRLNLRYTSAWLMLLVGVYGSGCKEETPVNAELAMVSAAHPLAAKAGLEAIIRGGNAIDAAVATAFTLSVVEPHSSGLGGGGFLVLYVQSENKVYTIDYRETAPAALPVWTDGGKTNERQFKHGGLSVAVPGMVQGLALAHKKFGRLSFGDLLKPAVYLAEKGVETTGKFNQVLKDNRSLLLSDPRAAETFFNSTRIGAGSRKLFVQKELAETLKSIQVFGPAALYGSGSSRIIARAVQAAGGVLTPADMANYKPRERKPIRISYRGYDIVTIGPPSAGGFTLAQTLKLLEHYDVSALGEGSPQLLALLVRAHEMSVRFCKEYVADPDQVTVPVDTLLSKEWVDLSLKKMPFPPGRIPEVGQRKSLSAPDRSGKQLAAFNPGNTTHFSIVDDQGNMVSLTQTINYPFGSGIVVPGMGFFLNNEMYDFTFDEKSVNRPGPGKIPRSNMTPLLIFKDGQPVGVLGTPGGPRIPATLVQILIHLIDFDRSMRYAVDAPRFYYDRSNRYLMYESRIARDTMKQTVRLLGGDSYEYALVRKPAYDRFFGGAHGIWISEGVSGSRILEGGADPRRDGIATGF